MPVRVRFETSAVCESANKSVQFQHVLRPAGRCAAAVATARMVTDVRLIGALERMESDQRPGARAIGESTRSRGDADEE